MHLYFCQNTWAQILSGLSGRDHVHLCMCLHTFWVKNALVWNFYETLQLNVDRESKQSICLVHFRACQVKNPEPTALMRNPALMETNWIIQSVTLDVKKIIGWCPASIIHCLREWQCRKGKCKVTINHSQQRKSLWVEKKLTYTEHWPNNAVCLCLSYFVVYQDAA